MKTRLKSELPMQSVYCGKHSFVIIYIMISSTQQWFSELVTSDLKAIVENYELIHRGCQSFQMYTIINFTMIFINVSLALNIQMYYLIIQLLSLHNTGLALCLDRESAFIFIETNKSHITSHQFEMLVMGANLFETRP